MRDAGFAPCGQLSAMSATAILFSSGVRSAASPVGMCEVLVHLLRLVWVLAAVLLPVHAFILQCIILSVVVVVSVAWPDLAWQNLSWFGFDQLSVAWLILTCPG